jgi:translation initiation factor IF-3
MQRKNQQVSLLKEIRLHPNTDVHDFDFKVKHAINFLEEGNKVKAVYCLRAVKWLILNRERTAKKVY